MILNLLSNWEKTEQEARRQPNHHLPLLRVCLRSVGKHAEVSHGDFINKTRQELRDRSNNKKFLP